MRTSGRSGWNRRGFRPRRPSDVPVNLEGTIDAETRKAVQEGFIADYIADTSYAPLFNGISVSKGRIQVRYVRDPENSSFDDLPKIYRSNDAVYNVEYLQTGRIKALDFRGPIVE